MTFIDKAILLKGLAMHREDIARISARTLDALLKSGDILTVRQVSKILGHSHPTGTRQLIHRGRLNTIRVGASYFVLRVDLEQYQKSRKTRG